MKTCASAASMLVARAVIRRNGRVLLVRRAPSDSFGGWWELPGGKVDARETSLLALAREVAEETALVADGAVSAEPLFELGLRSPSGRTLVERVYGMAAAGEPALSGEHDAWVWHDPATPAPGRLTSSAAAALS
jgi:8-oxo-dGTP diphosphatase